MPAGQGSSPTWVSSEVRCQEEDRPAATLGLENRCPFLDHRIIEFAFGIPPDRKIRSCSLKWTLRLAVGIG